MILVGMTSEKKNMIQMIPHTNFETSAMIGHKITLHTSNKKYPKNAFPKQIRFQSVSLNIQQFLSYMLENAQNDLKRNNTKWNAHQIRACANVQEFHISLHFIYFMVGHCQTNLKAHNAPK